MFIAIACYPVCDFRIFEIYLSFPIRAFSYMSKNSEQKLKYLKKEKSFYGKIKNIFHHFYRAFSFQKYNCLRLESKPLND